MGAQSMSPSSTRIVTVFPGQGSQFVGMGRAVVERDVEARRAFEEASDALGYDLITLCLDGPSQELDRTERAQPAIVACSVSIYRALERQLELEPVCAAGHSLGTTFFSSQLARIELVRTVLRVAPDRLERAREVLSGLAAKGDLLAKLGRGLVRAQAPLLGGG
jgi:[acyl-carrier-protein] S-malonyltransferase